MNLKLAKEVRKAAKELHKQNGSVEFNYLEDTNKRKWALGSDGKPFQIQGVIFVNPMCERGIYRALKKRLKRQHQGRA